MIPETLFKSLRESAAKLASLNATQKNDALRKAAASLDEKRAEILKANKIDVKKAREAGMSESLVDRLLLTDARISVIIESLYTVIAQADPVGEIIEGWKTASGIEIKKMRVPIGVAAIIYESRPNVTVEAFALAWKSGNALLLRGSSSALESNKALVKALKAVLPVPGALELAVGGRDEAEQIMQARGSIDVVIPRGGKDLIKTVCEKATVPVIETGSGVCHLFIDKSADIKTALSIAENAKLQRPGVCNAIETLLVHKACAETFLPRLVGLFAGRAEFRCCEQSFPILKEAAEHSDKADVRKSVIRKAEPEDFGFEFLDYILAVKIVDSIYDAVTHINTYNSGHSEAIVTEDRYNARFFQSQVDASCVYVNASTRFTDGGEFGFGAEWGISTQKLHIRGPMGVNALTTTKYCIDGEGQIR